MGVFNSPKTRLKPKEERVVAPSSQLDQNQENDVQQVIQGQSSSDFEGQFTSIKYNAPPKMAQKFKDLPAECLQGSSLDAAHSYLIGVPQGSLEKIVSNFGNHHISENGDSLPKLSS